MTTIATLIPWAIICATYIRYRKIIQREELQENTVEAANSPLQPYLAYYGLAWCLFIGIRASSILYCLCFLFLFYFQYLSVNNDI